MLFENAVEIIKRAARVVAFVAGHLLEGGIQVGLGIKIHPFEEGRQDNRIIRFVDQTGPPAGLIKLSTAAVNGADTLSNSSSDSSSESCRQGAAE